MTFPIDKKPEERVNKKRSAFEGIDEIPFWRQAVEIILQVIGLMGALAAIYEFVVHLV